jgi:hypothetical protein
MFSISPSLYHDVAVTVAFDVAADFAVGAFQLCMPRCHLLCFAAAAVVTAVAAAAAVITAVVVAAAIVTAVL